VEIAADRIIEITELDGAVDFFTELRDQQGLHARLAARGVQVADEETHEHDRHSEQDEEDARDAPPQGALLSPHLRLGDGGLRIEVLHFTVSHQKASPIRKNTRNGPSSMT